MWQDANKGSDNWALKLINGPAIEPITVAEAKKHLRVDMTDDDDYINALIVAARMIAEERTNRALITQTWDQFIDDFPTGDTIILKKPCLQSVESVNYTDSDGQEHIMPTSDYVVDSNSEPGRIFLGFAKIWPVVVLQPAAAVRIRFIAGYGDKADSVPQALKNAMLLLIGNWYANREIVEVNNRYAVEIPKTFDILFGPYKVRRFQ